LLTYIVVPIVEAPSGKLDSLVSAAQQLQTPSLARGLPALIKRACAIGLFAVIGRAVLGLRL
jgi:hypothetical protein